MLISDYFCKFVAFSSIPENMGMQRVRIAEYRNNLQSSLILFFKNHHSHAWVVRLLIIEIICSAPQERLRHAALT